MRRLYTLLFYGLLLLVLLRLYWRGIKAPDYRLRWRERLGFYVFASQQHLIWLHAVSVGEAEAAFSLIKRLMAEHTDCRFLVTTTTPTGSARVREVLGDQVEHVYLPYDLPPIVARFLTHFRPRLAVIMEKEVWPNLYAACAERAIPLYIINARLSARSASAYKKIPWLIQPALNCVSLIAAQTDDDAARFIEIGANPEQVKVFGNIKFDMQIADDLIAAGSALRHTHFIGRFVWIIASTHHDEEAQLLSLYPQLKKCIPELLLLIAPRHPERFQVVRKLCKDQGLSVVMRSENVLLNPATDIYLADSIGELKMLYATADLAFVGGSLVEVGGHNLLEPALVGVPVLFGPHMFNFQEIADNMLRAEAALQCQTPEAVAEAVLQLYRNDAMKQQLINNAREFVMRNQGATERIVQLLAG